MLLIFLISSTVVYNSIGCIDELSLDQLRVILNLKKCLGSKCGESMTKFVWVLRDFALQLIDKNGREMTPNQYLESCLEETTAMSLESRKKNEIRRAIKENLSRRSCHTLLRPTINEDDLEDLSNCKLRG